MSLLQVEEAETIVKLTEELDSIDTGLLEEASKIVRELSKALDRFELTQLLSGPYDKEGAVVTVTAGAGGTDAQVFFCFKFSSLKYHNLFIHSARYSLNTLNVIN